MELKELNNFIQNSKNSAKRKIKKVFNIGKINELENKIDKISNIDKLYTILHSYPEYEELEKLQKEQLEIYYIMLIGFVKKGDIYNASNLAGKIELLKQQINEPKKIQDNILEYKKNLEKLEV